MTTPPTGLYDPAKSYAYNLEHGPFGDYAGGASYCNDGEPGYDFFGMPVYSPFGIAAGPLPAARFIEGAFRAGYDIVTFKSVRTRAYPCPSLPNVLPLAQRRLDPDTTDNPITVAGSYGAPLTIANSFGVPSFDPEVWQPDMRAAFKVVGTGQAMLVAFQGTDRGAGHEAFITDHVDGVALLHATGARIVEVNLSCPNEGSPRLLCFDPASVRRIAEGIRARCGDVRLIVKVAYFDDDRQLQRFVEQVGPLVDGITAINTLGAKVVDSAGAQAFPGSPARAKPGVSGRAIQHLGLDMVRRLRRHRDELGLDFTIIGVGGVATPADFGRYRTAGADIVMAVTGAMWNAGLAAEIKETL